MSKTNYRGNLNLKRANVQLDWTQEQIEEYIKCKNDIFYFIEKYFKIITEDGIISMEIRDYQKDMITSMMNNRFTMTVQARQSGKSESFRAFLLHYILFNDFKTVGVVANKADAAMEIIGKLQVSYQYLPAWMQLGVLDWNKGSFALENQSRILTSATSKDAFRGYTIHILIIDEAAHIENWKEFYSAVRSTITAGKNTKLIMASTPNGLNHFYDFFEASDLGTGIKKNTNGFHAIFVPWWRVPGRDDAWKETELATMNYNYAQFAQEQEVSFIGSSGTLISGGVLKKLKESYKIPTAMMHNNKFKIYEQPIKKIEEWDKDEEKLTIYDPHQYVLIADVSRGKGLDHSAFSVIDITALPYKQAATYRDNETTVTDYTQIILNTAEYYNNACILTEINDMGEQVGNQLVEDYNYENVLHTEGKGRNGKKISWGGKGSDRGIRTTEPVKLSGCLLLKLLIEQDKLIINDFETIMELNVFSRDKKTYKAESGFHDDLVMTLVLFGWLSDQAYFKELTDIDTIQSFRERSFEEIQSELLPVGFTPNNTREVEFQGHINSIYNLNLPFNPFELKGPLEAITLPNF